MLKFILMLIKSDFDSFTFQKLNFLSFTWRIWQEYFFAHKYLCFYFSPECTEHQEYLMQTQNFVSFCSIKGKKASAGGGGVWRRCGRDFGHWCWHDGRRSLCLSFFIHINVENRAHQRANWLQATPQTCHAADTVRKFTVLSKSTFVFSFFSNVKLLYFFCTVPVKFI